MNEKQSVCILGDGIHALSVATALASSGYYTTIVAPPDAFENSVFGHDDAHLMVDMMYYRNKILYHDQLIDLFDKACHQKLISFCTISQIKKTTHILMVVGFFITKDYWVLSTISWLG